MTALARLARMPPVPGERAAVLRPPRPLPPWAPLASLLLHAAALVGVLVLLERSRAPEAPADQGVEVIWDQSAESELVSGAPSPAQPPMVEAPPTPEAERPPPPPVAAPAVPPPAMPPPPAEALRAPPEIAPPPMPLPPAEPAPALALQLPPPPEATPPVTLPPPEAAPPVAPPPPAAAEPEPAEEVPLPPPLPPPAPPRPAPARPAPAQPAPAAAQPGPTAPAQAPVPTGGSQAIGRVTPPGLLAGVRNAEPDYPFASRQRGEQGVVGLVVRVSEDGRVTGVEVAQSSGHPALDASAQRAVMQWRLKPAMRDGVPIPGSIRTSIHFSLR